MVYAMKPREILSLRQRLGLTQERFAHLIGVSREAVTHWESGIRKPSGPAVMLLKQIREKAHETAENAAEKNLAK